MTIRKIHLKMLILFRIKEIQYFEFKIFVYGLTLTF